MIMPNKQPLRVLLVSHYFPPHLGGIENVVFQEAIHLERHGADVAVLTSGSGTATTHVGDRVRVVSAAAWNGTETRRGVPFPVLTPRVLSTAMGLARWADVVHLHDVLYMTSWAAGIACALTRTPYLLTQHVGLIEHPSALVHNTQVAVYALAGRRLLRNARRVLVVNARVGAFAISRGARAAAVSHFPNGVDAELFHPVASAAERVRLRRQFGLPQDRVLVLFVGRLVPKKGCDLLLAAADPAYDLVFVGDGAGIVSAGRHGVHHLDALGPSNLADVYRACDIFALPSTAEGFPLTVQEAMASGLPVVTSDDPGYRPYHLDRGQIMLLPRDAGALRRALSSLATDSQRRARMGSWSRRYAVTSFAWEEHTAGLLRMYAGVAHPEGPADRPDRSPAGSGRPPHRSWR